MKRNMFKAIIISTLTLLGSSPLYAAVCIANVAEITTNGNGTVKINFNDTDSSASKSKTICDLDEEYSGVSPTTCAIWTSTAQRAMKEGTSLKLYFPDGTNTCSEFINSNNATALHSLSVTDSFSGGTTGGGSSSNEQLNVSNISSNTRGETFNYSFNVPSGTSLLNVDLTNVTGDPDLYVNYGSVPTTSDWACRPFNSDDTDELCTIDNPQAGTWHVMIVADDPFNGANLNTNTQ